MDRALLTSLYWLPPPGFAHAIHGSHQRRFQAVLDNISLTYLTYFEVVFFIYYGTLLGPFIWDECSFGTRCHRVQHIPVALTALSFQDCRTFTRELSCHHPATLSRCYTQQCGRWVGRDPGCLCVQIHRRKQPSVLVTAPMSKACCILDDPSDS